MKSKSLKNQCQKRAFFWHRLFRVLASIWEGLWPPSWSQIGRPGLPGPSPKPPKSNLLGTFCQDASQEALKWAQRGPKEGPEVHFSRIFDGFGKLFWLILAVQIDYLNRNSRYHMYLLSDAIT